MIQRFLVAAVSLAATVLAGCGGGDDPSPPVSVFKSLGSVQCTGGGTSVAALQQQLAAAGVNALAASCGDDGLAHVTVCGATDGRIGIVDIPAAQLDAAAALGFARLSNLPDAVRRACS